MLTRLGGTRHITMPIFFQNWSIHKAEILQFFNVPNGRRRDILFLKSPIFWLQRIKTHEHVKFWQNRSIGYEDTCIKIFFNFSNWQMLPS